RFDLVERDVALELDGQRLTVAAHGADAHAGSVDRRGWRAKALPATENLDGFSFGLPFFARHTVAQVLVDPGDEVAAQGHAKVFLRQRRVLLRLEHATIDFQDRRGRIVEQRLDRLVEQPELGEKFAHVLRAAAGSRLVGHGCHPFDQVVIEEACQAHEHAADRAVAPDEIAYAALERRVDRRPVDRVEDDDGVVFHAQRAGRVDPDARPARRAQLGEYLGGVVAALRRDDDGQFLQSIDVVGVLQRAGAIGPGGRSATGVAGGKENGVDQGEVVFVTHALHENGTDHAAPADQAYCLRHVQCSWKNG